MNLGLPPKLHNHQDSNIQALSYTPPRTDIPTTVNPPKQAQLQALAPNLSRPVAAYHVLCIASAKRSPHPAAV